MSSKIGSTGDANLSPIYQAEVAKAPQCTTSSKTEVSVGWDKISVTREKTKEDCGSHECKDSASHPNYQPGGGSCIIA